MISNNSFILSYVSITPTNFCIQLAYSLGKRSSQSESRNETAVSSLIESKDFQRRLQNIGKSSSQKNCELTQQKYQCCMLIILNAPCPLDIHSKENPPRNFCNSIHMRTHHDFTAIEGQHV